MSKNQIKAGTILTYVHMFLNIVLGFINQPLMISALGKSEYGLYNTVSSTINMLSILSLGFSAGYIRYYSKYNKENDKVSIYKLNGMYLIIFSIISLIALICGMIMSFNLRFIFSTGFTDAEYSLARTLSIILTVNISLSFLTSVFTAIVTANERFVFLKLLGILKTVCTYAIVLPALILGAKSIFLVIVTVSVSFAVDVIYIYYILFVLKEKFHFRGFEKGIIKSLFTYTVFIAINLIVDQINGNIDKVLLGRFNGTEVVAVYSLGFMFYNYYTMFSTSISSVFAPRIHKLVVSTSDNKVLQNQELTKLFTRVGRIQYLILALICSGFIVFGMTFITEFWADESFSTSYYVALLLLLPGTIPLIQNIGIEVQRALNLHRFRSIIYIVMAFLNLIMTWFLCQKYGAIGATLGTAISLILANGIVMNIFYHKKCNINVLNFWKNILRLSVGLIVPLLCGVLIIKFIDLENIFLFLSFIVFYIIIYFFSMYFLAMSKYEKSLVKKFINKFTRRNNVE